MSAAAEENGGAATEDLDAIFQTFRDELDADHCLRDEIREIIRELEQKARDLLTCMQKVHHHCHSKEHMEDVCEKSWKFLPDIKDLFTRLESKVSVDYYYKHHDVFRFVCQRLCFLVSFLCFLECGSLISREAAAKTLGVGIKRTEGFHLDLEDYLSGLLILASELSRFAVNSVTCGDFNRPFQIVAFLSELDAGFRQLNLKNDHLRKRFDALKYDVKKVEEIVYDLKIRGLKTGPGIVEDEVMTNVAKIKEQSRNKGDESVGE